MKVAMIGEASSVVGFRALGVDAFEVAKPEDAPGVWESLDPERYAVIFVTDDLAEVLAPYIEPLAGMTLPVVTMIPPVSGGTGASLEQLRALVEKAVGIDLFSS